MPSDGNRLQLPFNFSTQILSIDAPKISIDQQRVLRLPVLTCAMSAGTGSAQEENNAAVLAIRPGDYRNNTAFGSIMTIILQSLEAAGLKEAFLSRLPLPISPTEGYTVESAAHSLVSLASLHSRAAGRNLIDVLYSDDSGRSDVGAIQRTLMVSYAAYVTVHFCLVS